MPTYRVLPAPKTFGRHAPGTLLELTEAEYAGLNHLLELIQPGDADSPSAPADGAVGADGDVAGTDTPARTTRRRRSG